MNLKDTLSFNINDHVYVQLNDYGRECLREEHRRLCRDLRDADLPYTPPEESEDGWSEWQLWYLMYTFGSYLFHGGKVPFATEIKVEILDKATYD